MDIKIPKVVHCKKEKKTKKSNLCTVYCKCEDCKDIMNWSKHFMPRPGNPFLKRIKKT